MAIPAGLWREGICRGRPAGIVQRLESGVLEARKAPERTAPLHYLRSIIFDAAVVILTLVISLSVPFLALFNASSTTVRAVSQVWAGGIMFLMKYVVGLDY